MRLAVVFAVLLVFLAFGGVAIAGFVPMHPKVQTVEQKLDDSRLPR